jgi:Uma2 family endonuclease
MKRQLYGKRGVKEYWILDPQMRTIEIYRRRARGLRLVATLTNADLVTTPLLPGFSCHVYEFFAA